MNAQQRTANARAIYDSVVANRKEIRKLYDQQKADLEGTLRGARGLRGGNERRAQLAFREGHRRATVFQDRMEIKNSLNMYGDLLRNLDQVVAIRKGALQVLEIREKAEQIDRQLAQNQAAIDQYKLNI